MDTRESLASSFLIIPHFRKYNQDYLCVHTVQSFIYSHLLVSHIKFNDEFNECIYINLC